MSSPSPNGRTALICAMPMELKPLVRKLSLQKTQIGGVTVHAGTLGGREVVAIVTGMGTKLATEATERCSTRSRSTASSSWASPARWRTSRRSAR